MAGQVSLGVHGQRCDRFILQIVGRGVLLVPPPGGDVLLELLRGVFGGVDEGGVDPGVEGLNGLGGAPSINLVPFLLVFDLLDVDNFAAPPVDRAEIEAFLHLRISLCAHVNK